MPIILLADDHPATRELVAERLSVDGYEVVAVEDPSSAYERFSALRPDLVIASLALPPLDGAHLFQAIGGGGRRVPMLVYDQGHRGEPRGVKAVLDLRANAYVPDPTRHDVLGSKVAELLSARRGAKDKGGSDAPSKGPSLEGRPLAKKGLPTDARRAAPSDTRGAEAPSYSTLSRGSLGPGRLATLLLDAWLDSITGTIRLTTKRGEAHAIKLEEGSPVGISSSEPRASLVRWLEREGRIDAEAAGEILDLSVREGLSSPGALIAAGVIEAGPPLLELLREHAKAVIRDWIALKSGSFVVTAEATPSKEFGPKLELRPLPLVREGALLHHPVSVWQASLSGRLDEHPYRTDDFGRHLESMALSPREITFAMKMDGRTTARSLLASARGDFKKNLLILWFLERVGAIDFSREPLLDSDEGLYELSRLSAGRKKKPLPESQREELLEEALRIVTASYFSVLGVDITATVEDVERAYHDLATRFHPESWEEYDLSDLDDLFQTVLDRAGAAYRVLSIEEKRKGYLAHLMTRHPSELRRGRVVPEAEIALKRGNNRLEQGDVAGAVVAFQEAVDLNAKEPAYLAHLALASFMSSHGPPESRAKSARPLLKKALQLDDEHEQANLVSALIDDACGRRDDARTKALSVLRRNPKSEVGKALLSRANRA